MQINTLTMAQAINWFKSGWTIFANNPVQWIFILIILFIISLISNVIPMIGGLIFAVITPTLFAGIFLATEKSANGDEISLNDLFSVLVNPSQRTPFLYLGLFSFFVNVLIILIIFVPMMGGISNLSHFSSNSADMMPAMAAGAGFGSLFLVLPVLIIYVMAMVYAIPLMLFSKQDMKDALLLSLKASFSNVLVMLFASLIYLLLFLLALIPAGLGLLVLFPVSFGIVYASYKDIFR